MLTVRADNYRAFYIRALIWNIVFLKLFYSLLVRVTVVVILAAGDERKRRRHDLEKFFARRCAAAVVTELQYIGFDIRAVCENLFLALLFGIAREEERILAVDNLHHNGGVV